MSGEPVEADDVESFKYENDKQDTAEGEAQEENTEPPDDPDCDVPAHEWETAPPIPKPLPYPAEDPRVEEIVHEIHKAAIDNIRDEEYWDGLIMRAKDLKVIQDPIRPKEDEDTLFGAVRANEIAKVEELLKAGEDPNQQNENGTYPMHFACIKNYITVAKSLLHYGGSVTVSNHAGLTPLHCAVDVGGSLKLCIWLVSNGAEVDVPSATGKTPLHCTCLQGFREIAQWLLKKGANVHAETTDGCVALHFACHRGSTDLVDLLTESGADLNVANNKGETPFMWACDRGHLDLVMHLREKRVNVVARSSLGHTALHYAALNGHIDVVIYLVHTAGIDINAPDNEMGTALHCACQKGHHDCALWLMENGGLMGSVTTSKVSLLHSACDGGDLRLIQFLCDKGLDPAAKDTDMRTPLHYACYRGNKQVVEWFFNNFENIDQLMCVTNKRGSNCLHVACQKGHIDLVKYLVACGVPINAQNNAGNTPFHMASENGHIELAEWLAANGAELWV